MAEHQSEQESALRPLNKALWIQELNELEQEFLAYQQRSSSALPGASTQQTLAYNHPE